MKRLIPLVLIAWTTLAPAEPAPWYWWVSASTGDRVCLQTSPGEGWYRERQPFRDARCSIRIGQ